MRFESGLFKAIGITLLVVLLVMIQPVFGLAESSHSQSEGSSEDMSQEMDMDNGTHEKDNPEVNGAEETEMPEMTEEEHEQDKSGAESGHGESEESDQGINWPVILGFAGINGAALLSAAVLRKKKLRATEVNNNVG